MIVESKTFDLLVVDADSDFRRSVVQRLVDRGFRVQEASNVEQASAELELQNFDVVLVDSAVSGIVGGDLPERIRTSTPECEVVQLTKSNPPAELDALIEKACRSSRLGKENAQLKAALDRSQPSSEIVGDSPSMHDVFRIIEQAGPSDAAVLIEGESGTGKELAARALHRAGPRAARPFVAIHCSALPETLLDSDLFGHEKGAFPGAVSSKLGVFEIADGGTLFIDEIGEMSDVLQAKLLRVLEDGSVRRVGSTRGRRVDVRIIAATSRDLQAQVRAGKFPAELFDRIKGVSLKLPPLRNRAGDVRLLVQKLLGPEWSIAADAQAALERYPWPGNVRQLINALERAKLVAEGMTIHLSDLPANIAGRAASSRSIDRTSISGDLSTAPMTDALAAVQRLHIVDILRRERGNKARTARALGINRRSLYRLLDKHRIDPAEAVGEIPRADGLELADVRRLRRAAATPRYFPRKNC